MMNNWFKEKRLFHAGKFPDVCDGDWSNCAHYSQAIWEATTAIGCGMASSVGFQWMVCRYNPGGNKDGKWVGTPVSIATADSQKPTIRPRLIGGDYGNQACEGPPVEANGAIPANTADCGEGVIKPTVDLVGDITDHGNDDDRISGQSGADTTLQPDVANAVVSASMLDDEFWGASAGALANLSEGTRLELGIGSDDYDGPIAGSAGGGVYWDPVNQVTVGAGVTYVEVDSGPGEWPDIVGDLRLDQAWGTLQAAGAAKNLIDPKVGQPAPTTTDASDFPSLESYLLYSTDAFIAQLDDLIGKMPDDLDWSDSKVCRLEPSVTSNYDLGTGLYAAAFAQYEIPLSGDDPTDKLWFWGGGIRNKVESEPGEAQTNIQPPDLGGLPEVYDPAAKPKDPNAPPCEM
jgi:hypothetical protein